MLRAFRKFCLVGTPVLALACTGQIGDGGHRTSGPGQTPDPGPDDPGDVTPPTDMPKPDPGKNPDTLPPSIDPPQTISPGGKCVSGKPGPRMLRRLTTEQLDNSVRDL